MGRCSMYLSITSWWKPGCLALPATNEATMAFTYFSGHLDSLFGTAFAHIVKFEVASPPPQLFWNVHEHSRCQSLFWSQRLQSSSHTLSSSVNICGALHTTEILNFAVVKSIKGFPGSSAGKESACNAGGPSLIPGLGRSAGEALGYPLQYSWAPLVAHTVKNLPATWETWVQSLGGEGPLEEGMATHSSILDWRISMVRGV